MLLFSLWKCSKKFTVWIAIRINYNLNTHRSFPHKKKLSLQDLNDHAGMSFHRKHSNIFVLNLVLMTTLIFFSNKATASWAKINYAIKQNLSQRWFFFSAITFQCYPLTLRSFFFLLPFFSVLVRNNFSAFFNFFLV